MTETRQLFLELAPSVFADPLDATAGILLDIAAERVLREGAEDPIACDAEGRLHFVGDEVRDRIVGRLATLPPDRLDALEEYALALHDRIAGSLIPGNPYA